MTTRSNPLPSPPRRHPVLAAAGLVVLSGLLLAAARPDATLDHAIATQRDHLIQQPMDAAGHSDLGNLLTLSGQEALAESAYLEALRLSPSLYDANFNYGLLLVSQERAKLALKHLRVALDLEPDTAWAHYHYGTALLQVGDRRGATRSFARAFRLDPRLAFPDVNPAVISNPLLTKALLMAHDQPGTSPNSPRVYGDPARIAGLLAPPPPPPQGPAPVAEPTEVIQATAVQTPDSTSTGAQPIPSDPSIESTFADTLSERQQIDGEPEDTLEPADPGAMPETGLEPERRTRVARPQAVPAPVLVVPSTSPSTRTLTPDDLRSGGSINQTSPQGSGSQGSQGGRFRPGSRSSAQLELRLVPRSRDVRAADTGEAVRAGG